MPNPLVIIASRPAPPLKKTPAVAGVMLLKATTWLHNATAGQPTYRIRQALGRPEGTFALISKRSVLARARSPELFRPRDRSRWLHLAVADDPLDIIYGIVGRTAGGVHRLRQHQDLPRPVIHRTVNCPKPGHRCSSSRVLSCPSSRATRRVLQRRKRSTGGQHNAVETVWECDISSRDNTPHPRRFESNMRLARHHAACIASNHSVPPCTVLRASSRVPVTVSARVRGMGEADSPILSCPSPI